MARDQWDVKTLEMFAATREQVKLAQQVPSEIVSFPTTNKEFLDQAQWVREQFKAFLGTAASVAGAEVVLYVTLKLLIETMRDDKKLSFGNAVYYLMTIIRGAFPDSGGDAA